MYDAAEAVRFIRSHESFLVLGHKEPDGDCVASQLGMAALLGALGKKVSVFSVGPFDRPEISEFQDSFGTTILAGTLPGAAVIIVDCSTPDRTGELGKSIGEAPCLVIDHHSSGSPFGTVRFIDSSAPSSTMLVLQLFDDMAIRPDADTARLLLFGLCTDTGFFRHLSLKGADTFRAVARLAEYGTSTAEVYMMVYGRRALSARKLLAEMLARTESHADDRFLLTWQTIEDRERLSALQRGEDDLYRLLQTVRGNVVVALVKEERPGAFSVGLRSTTAVDVGAIAGSFGGGGHRQAAGFDIDGTLASVKKTLLDTFLPIVFKM
jgi:phosphoesterase RecJ-like protein